MKKKGKILKHFNKFKYRPFIHVNVKKKPKNFAAFFGIILCMLFVTCVLQLIPMNSTESAQLRGITPTDSSTIATTLKDIFDYENVSVFNQSGYQRPLYESLKLKDEKDPNLFSEDLYNELNSFMPEDVLLPHKSFIVSF